MPDRLTIDKIDADLMPGAHNAIEVCLRVQPDERVTIITDQATREIAAALQAESKKLVQSMRFSCWKIMRGDP